MQVAQIEKLEIAFGREQAFTSAEILDDRLKHELDLRELATKKDIKELEISTKHEIEELRIETNHNLKELELRRKIWPITAFILISAFFNALDYFVK